MQNNVRSNSPRPPSDWQPVQDFYDEGGLVVRVKRDMASKWPRFSLEIGKTGNEPDRILRFLPVPTDRPEPGQVRLKDPLITRLVPLLEQAEGYILNEAQRMEDEFQASRPNDGPKVMRVTGKTERDRNKRRGNSQSRGEG